MYQLLAVDGNFTEHHLEDLRKLIRSGAVTGDAMVKLEGAKNWTQAKHLAELFPPEPKAIIKKRVMIVGGVGCASLAIVAVLIVACLLLAPSITTKMKDAAYRAAMHREGEPPQFLTTTNEQIFKDSLERDYNQKKQSILQAIHPEGTAKSVTFNSLHITWGRNIETPPYREIARIDATYTLFWQTPEQPEGLTEVAASLESGFSNWSIKVTKTNGATRGGVTDLK